MSPGRAACANVAVPLPPRQLFTYRVPESARADVSIGCQVRVPLGRRVLDGVVVEWPVDDPADRAALREIRQVHRDRPKLGPALLELTRFVADYYLCSWGEAIEAALPPRGKKRRGERRVRRVEGVDADAVPARATVQRRVLERLPGGGKAIPLSHLDEPERRAVALLARRGFVEVEHRDSPAGEKAGRPERGPQLTPAQQAVSARVEDAMAEGAHRAFLLHGVTGSGKTEVYLRAAERALDSGRTVLYLVPEIALTPLLAARVKRRFPGQVAVLHSGRSATDRRDAWERLRRGDARIALGTRSAVFAPLDRIGLVVVDEEHDASYKQAESPRYNGRDVAVVRARNEGAVVILGSATPSMESYQHAAASKYELLELVERIEQRPLPDVRLVDMRETYQAAGEITPLSGELLQAVAETIARGEQVLILRNRRGWATAAFCPTCGHRVHCRRCSIDLTWHRAAARLRCHYCAFETRLPPRCPFCAEDELKLVGEGTEKIEDALGGHLRDARIERLDRDTTRRRGAHESILRRFEAHEIDVLVGTQMIAKGHDFHNVTLVGVLSADQSLGLPDFRAGERTFQLLTQVAGRAGRGERPGTVIVQAYDPSHPVIRLAATQHYVAFFEHEIRYRRALAYPPAAGMVALTVADRDPLRCAGWADNLADALRAAGPEDLLVAGPGPAPIERLHGKFRRQILVRHPARRRLVGVVDAALSGVEGAVPARAVRVDVDPQSLM